MQQRLDDASRLTRLANNNKHSRKSMQGQINQGPLAPAGATARQGVGR